MIKKITIFIICLIAVLFANSNVMAEETSDEVDTVCSSEDMARFNELASDIKVTYESNEELVDDHEDEEFWYTQYVLDLIIYNLSDDMYAIIKATDSHNSIYLNKDNKNNEGNVVLRINDTSSVQNLTMIVYADGLGCKNKLRTITVTLPRYNYYSNFAICDDIPEYYLCQKYITFTVNGETFSDEVTKYKEKMALQSEEIDIDFGEDNNNAINQTISFFSKYKYIFVALIIWIGVILTFVILKKKKGSMKNEK